MILDQVMSIFKTKPLILSGTRGKTRVTTLVPTHVDTLVDTAHKGNILAIITETIPACLLRELRSRFGLLLPNDFQPGFPSRLAPSSGSLAVLPSLLVSIITFDHKIMPQVRTIVNDLKKYAFSSQYSINLLIRQLHHRK